jgi:hypothetical protein
LEEIVAPAPKRISVRSVNEEVEKFVAVATTEKIDAVVSTDDYPGSTLAAIVARRLGLPGTSVTVDLLCQRNQESGSFRYGPVHLGGRSRKDIHDKFAWCR